MDNKCPSCVQHGPEICELDVACDPRRRPRSKDLETEAQVKEVFRQLLLNEHYEEYEDMAYAYNRINALIDVDPDVTSPCGEAVLRCTALNTLEKIYKRTK